MRKQNLRKGVYLRNGVSVLLLVTAWMGLSNRVLAQSTPTKEGPANPTGEAAFFRFPVPGGCVVTRDLVTLIVSVPEEAKLVYFDTVTNRELKRVELDFKPAELALQGNTLFAAAQGSALVYGLDAQTGKVKKEYNLESDAVAHLACHPSKGLLYASTATRKVYSIDPANGAVTKTEAEGIFLAVDPVKGDSVYTGIQPPSEDEELIIKVGPQGTIKLIWDSWGARAAIVKYVVKGNGLKSVSAQKNAAVNGWRMQLTPDGKRIMIVGGGGWRPPAEGGTGGGYVIALFGTDNLETMLGQAPHGSGIIFHPVLNLGVVNQHGQDLSIFNAKALVERKKFHIAKGADQRSQVFAFAGKGTKVVLWNGANASNPVEGLHLLPLELSEEERAALQKVYGKLPPPAKNYAPAVRASGETAATAPAIKPTPGISITPSAKKETTRPARQTTKPAEPGKSSRGKPAVGLITFKGSSPAWKAVVAETDVPYLTDRGYAIEKLPKAMEGGSLVVRDSEEVMKWLSPGKVSASQDCTVYLAVLTMVNDVTKVSDEALGKLKADGWTLVDEPFETTSAEREVWEWKVLSKPVKKGPFKFSDKVGLRTQMVYVFK